MANRSITCRPTETARAFRRYDEDDSTVLAGIDGSRAPVLRMPKLAEVHEQPLGRGLKTLRGRRTECETLDRLLDGVRAGQSGALVVRGEPGSARPRCWSTRSSSGVRPPRCAGRRRRVGDGAPVRRAAPAVRAAARPARAPSAPQRDALETAFGLTHGGAAGPLPVGLAVLSLLSEAAEERPLVCVVDDAQWLDRASAQALAFVARRLLAESVALVVRRAREPSDDELAGLPELVVEGLRDGDARALLALGRSRGPLDERRARPDRRRDARQPAGAAGAAARADAGAAGGRVRTARTRAAVEPDRGELPPAARARCRRRPGGSCWSRRPSRSATRRCCGARPSGSAIAAGRGRAGRGGRPARARRAGALPPSAGALGGLPGGVGRRAAGGAPRAGRGDRPGARSRPPRLAPRAGGAGPRRGRRRGARALGRPGAGARRPGGGGRVPRARGRADARPGARARRALAAAQAKHQAGAPDAALELLAIARGGPARRARARPGRPAARPDRVRRAAAAATRRRCCSTPPSGSSRSTPTLARETYLDAFARGDCSPAGWPAAAACARSREAALAGATGPAAPARVRPPARWPGAR